MTINYKGHEVLGTTSYGDIRCTTCEYNRRCYNGSCGCEKDWEKEAQLFEDVDILKKKFVELFEENQNIKQELKDIKDELAKYKLMSLF